MLSRFLVYQRSGIKDVDLRELECKHKGYIEFEMVYGMEEPYQVG